MTATVTLTPRKAPEPGALDGFLLTCSICGPVGSSSLPSTASHDATAHERYHAKRGGRK